MRRFALALLTLGTISSAANAQRTPLGSLQWFVGCWEMTRGTTRTIERWRAPAQNEMSGDSRTIANGADRESEKLRLFARGDTIVYEATPSGQARTEFRTTAAGQDEVIFANPAHDFPQRIVYRRIGSDSIVARIEGDRDNRRNPVSYPYRRVDCSTITESPTTQARTALQPRYDDMVARELVYPGATNGWFVDNAAQSFAHVTWSSSGSSVPVATKELLARADSGMKANPNRVPVTNRTFSATLEQVLVRGDTAEALVSMRRSWNFVDTPGSYGAAGATHERDGLQRRLDKWIRVGADWRLREVLVISDESSLDKRLVLKNGKSVGP